MLSAAQCRAARALLEWTQPELADASGLTLTAIVRFETGVTSPRQATFTALVDAFSRAGIVFINARNAEGVLLVRVSE